MAFPWLRLFDAALSVTDMVTKSRAGRADTRPERGVTAHVPSGRLEARLAGVVVSALKEAFNRDSQRIELERQQVEAERERARRALRLELLRQAGDRETGRLRLIVGVALAGWLGAFLVATRVLATTAGRVSVAAGLAALLGTIAAALSEESRLARAIAINDERLSIETLTTSGAAGSVAPWLLVLGYILIGLGAVIS